jgi:hypothetical protein
MPDMSRHLDTWAARRADFAAAVDLGDFQIVANAFANLERYVVAARANRFPTPGSLLPLVESIADARAAAWIASGAAVDQTIPTSIGLTITGLHRDAAGRVRLGSTAERDADDECDAQEREP